MMCVNPTFAHAIYRGGDRERSTGLNYAAGDCQVELRTASSMLKYELLCVCVRESTLVNVHV